MFWTDADLTKHFSLTEVCETGAEPSELETTIEEKVSLPDQNQQSVNGIKISPKLPPGETTAPENTLMGVTFTIANALKPYTIVFYGTDGTPMDDTVTVSKDSNRSRADC